MIAGTLFEVADIDDVWPRFESRAQRCGDPEALAHCLRRCANGDAMCLTCPGGMVILSLDCKPDGTIAAVVMLAVALGESNAFVRYEDSMVKIARELDANELKFKTDRKGWNRLLGPQWRAVSSDSFSRSI